MRTPFDEQPEQADSSEQSTWLQQLRQQLPPPTAPPEGYFERLPDQLWQRLQQEESKPKKSPLRRWLLLSVSVAAAALLLLIAARSLLRPENETKSPLATQDSSSQEPQPSPSPSPNTKSSEYSQLLAEISDEEINEYLLQNSEDIALSDLQNFAAPQIDSLYEVEYNDILDLSDEQSESLF